MTRPEKSIVQPSPYKGYSAPSVLLIPVDTPNRLFERTLEELSLKDLRLPMGRLSALKQQTVVLYGCIGAPATVLALESLAAGGAQDILLLGLCGSLCRRARLQDALLATHALSDEGTSTHYFPDRTEFHPNDDFMQSVESAVGRQGLPYLPAAVVSTDAPYRETPSWRERFLDSGMDGVDMETSAVFALAEFRGLRAASLLIVSDELSESGHNSGFGHPKMGETMTEYFMPFIREKSG